MATLSAPLNLGFLTVLREPTGYLGGYLVTNAWGRPLEFRISSAVQPNKVQQILYAATLEPYVCAEVIGKTLVEKAAFPVQAVVTETEVALDLRRQVEIPVFFLGTDKTLKVHPEFPGDQTFLQEVRERFNGMDLAEPFSRVREAMGEARKLGVSNRPAAAA